MIWLLPRLSKPAVDSILASHQPGFPAPRDINQATSDYSAYISYGASGGTKAPEVAFSIGDALRNLVPANGGNSQVTKAAFDREATVLLSTHGALQGGEALRNDVWAFLATVVVPDVVVWRYRDAKPERFHGGVRNAVQRLWFRGKALNRGEGHPNRWELARSIPEDAAVQILERTSLGGRPRLARAIAEGWMMMRGRTPIGRQEDVMRTATKIIRLQNQILDLQFLTDEQLSAIVREAFTKAGATL